jgi:hypothetical protein
VTLKIADRHAYLDREWGRKTNILNAIFVIFVSTKYFKFLLRANFFYKKVNMGVPKSPKSTAYWEISISGFLDTHIILLLEKKLKIRNPQYKD